jgi:hypothetical protein
MGATVQTKKDRHRRKTREDYLFETEFTGKQGHVYKSEQRALSLPQSGL